jgi:hypothetical protein
MALRLFNFSGGRCTVPRCHRTSRVASDSVAGAGLGFLGPEGAAGRRAVWRAGSVFINPPGPKDVLAKLSTVMETAKAIFPYRPLEPSGANLLILLAGAIVLVWFCRLVRFLQRVYELNVAITSGQASALSSSNDSSCLFQISTLKVNHCDND